LEAFLGYDHVVLIDAIQTEGGTPGDVYELSLADCFLPDIFHLPIRWISLWPSIWGRPLACPSIEDRYSRRGGGRCDELSRRVYPEVERRYPVAVETALRKCPAHQNYIGEG